MNEYAIRVYSLIDFSLKLDAAEYLEQARIALLPNNKEAKRIIDEYVRRNADPVEKFMLSNNREEAINGLELLNKVIGGNKK